MSDAIVPSYELRQVISSAVHSMYSMEGDTCRKINHEALGVRTF
jgi:hypothetical protein